MNNDIINKNNEKDEPNNIYLLKVNQLSSLYLFINTYTNSLCSLFKHFIDLYYNDIIETFNQDIKQNLKAFKEISLIYGMLSESVKNNSNQLNQNEKEDEFHLSKYLLNSENNLYSSMNNICIKMKTNIFDNPLYSRLDTFQSKIEKNLKEISKNIDKIEKRIKKIDSLYKDKYEKVFEQYKNKYNEGSIIDTLNALPDFIILEIQFSISINKLITKIKSFLNDSLLSFEANKNLLINYYSLLKEAFTIYTSNTLTLFNEENVFQSFGSVSQFLIETNAEEIEKKISISKIMKRKDKKYLKEFNNYLLVYQDALMQSTLVKNNSKYESNFFDIDNYSSISSFIHFLIMTIPNQITINYDLLIKGKYTVKYDPGMFKSWLDCTLLLTKQEHLFLYENDITNPNTMELNILKSEIVFENNKQYSKTNSEKRKNNSTIDCLNQENFENIKKVFNKEEKRKKSIFPKKIDIDLNS